jgi:hypothetical protein
MHGSNQSDQGRGSKARKRVVAAPARPRRRRSGVTSLEYLVMISSIIVVCILVIGSLGGITRGSFGTSSSDIDKATSK